MTAGIANSLDVGFCASPTLQLKSPGSGTRRVRDVDHGVYIDLEFVATWVE
jgi:hypothetical protein